MNAEEAKDMLQAKSICMELDGLSCIGKGCDHDCYHCEYNYAQGDIGEQKEALKRAIESLEKQIPKKPIIWEYKTYDSPVPNDNWGYECPYCGNRDIDYPDHHCICGQKLDWEEE